MPSVFDNPPEYLDYADYRERDEDTFDYYQAILERIGK